MQQACINATDEDVSEPVYQQLAFTSHDGTELAYHHWPAKQPSASPKAILLFHRGHEHGLRLAHLVDELKLPEFEFFAWDARGHGVNPGPRGYSPSFDSAVRDVQSFVEHVQQQHGIATENMALIAQSVGAVLAATWVHDYAPKIRCQVLASPAFDIKLYVPFARTGLKLMQALRGNFYVNSYVKAKYLTHDAKRIASYETDPLISKPISVNMLLGLYDAAERVVKDAQAITVTTQLLISGADWVVRQQPQLEFFANLGSIVKEKHQFNSFFHDTLGERDRDLALKPMRRFILDAFNDPCRKPDLSQLHLAGFTKYEADQLAQPLAPLSAKGLYWAATRWGLKLAGHLSAGVELGHQRGFDSGSTLDYVYRNQPTGRFGLGQLIDWSYLNSIGWRGIRQRKQHLEQLLSQAGQLLKAAGQPVHILDIAAGQGRYVLDAAAAVEPDSIQLRDYSDINVEQGRRLIQQKGLAGVARFEQADAFDPAQILTAEPKPTLAVVSGLYELFANNELIETSLAGVAQALPVGGYLLYTNQPWHPQLELIARALTSHRQGDAWVMRRRSQGEMDQLVERAGFRKLEQRIDQWGIFSVSLAQKL